MFGKGRSRRLLAVVAGVAAIGVGLTAPGPASSTGAVPVAADAGPEYVLYGPNAVWADPDLTYGFANHTDDLSVASQEAAVARALDQWAAATPLTFTLVADCGLPINDQACTEPDLRFGFYTGDHSDVEGDPAFTGGTVGHGFYPVAGSGTIAGDLHLDDDERWTTSGAGGVDLETVVLHEVGHALGIRHSDLTSCGTYRDDALRPAMCAVSINPDRTLAPDDLKAARALYGVAGATCQGFPVTVRLADGDRPTTRDDVILGTSGPDTINARNGDDVVCGGAGADTVIGGVGDDRLDGGIGRDTCDGQTGRDLATRSCEVRRGIP